MSTNTRRRFLLALGGAGCAAAIAAGAYAWKANLPLQRIERSNFALGARVSIIAHHADAAHAERAIENAFAELEGIEQVMSLYRPDSELVRLNQSGLLKDPDPSLVAILQSASEISHATQGAFDITIQPLWSVYARAKANNRLPTPDEINAARQYVDYRQVKATQQKIELLSANTRISLNGIAQGYALDCVRQSLAADGVEHALIDTGEFGGLGEKPENEPWKIGVQHPRHHDQLARVVPLDGRCLATSGDYATTFSTGREQHHLFDPSTGKSPTELASVSVLAPTGLLADACSTALFVMGARRGMKWLETLENVDALFITKQGEVQSTNRFPTGLTS